MMDAWIRPELDPSRADYPGDYVAAREYERSLWDQMQLNERLCAQIVRLQDEAWDAYAEADRVKTLWEECEKDNKQLEAEVEKLRRDNDLLREALRNG